MYDFKTYLFLESSRNLSFLKKSILTVKRLKYQKKIQQMII